MSDCISITPSNPHTNITETEALSFVQALRPVGLIELRVTRIVQDEQRPRGIAYVAACWKAIQPDQRTRTCLYQASEVEQGHRVLLYVQKRSDGTIFAMSYVCGDPWIQDWCRPLEESDTVQDGPIPADIADPSLEECCQPTLAWLLWSLDALQGIDTPYPLGTQDQATSQALPQNVSCV